MRSKPISSVSPWPLSQFLSTGSCPAWVPAITAFDEELLYGNMSETNHFFPQVTFDHGVSSQEEKPKDNCPMTQLCTPAYVSETNQS